MDRKDARKLIHQYASVVQAVFEMPEDRRRQQATTLTLRDEPDPFPVPRQLVQALASDVGVEHLRHIIDMAEGCADHSERKMMRWLGYIQGVLHCLGMFSLEELKHHSKSRVVTRPAWLSTGA